MKHRIFTFILFLLFHCSSAQFYNETDEFLKMNNIWVFGENSGLDFNNLQSPPRPIQSAINSIESSASVSDTKGNLLFYLGSNSTIWNRNHVPMLNGTGLYPYHPYANGSSSTQGNVIIPMIDTPWKYYVFTNMQREAVFSNPILPSPYLSYSVVDMTLDSGYGGIEPGRKNIPLYHYGLGESMIAIPGNNCDIWLVSVSYSIPNNPNLTSNTLCFLAWNISAIGIDPNPVVSYTFSNPEVLNSSISQMLSVSPDRKKIALANNNGVILSKFDANTGMTSESIVLPVAASNNYGVCFSPDNQKLYVITMSGAFNSASLLRQYNISTHNPATIMPTEYKITEEPIGGNLRLYNGKIYSSLLARINNPNQIGVGCGFQINEIPDLEGRQFFGLPTEVVGPYRGRYTSTQYDTICKTNSALEIKTLNAPEGFTFYEWDNGLKSPTRPIDGPGMYWVTYHDSKCSNIFTDTFNVQLLDLSFSLGRDTAMFFCNDANSYLQLKVPDTIVFKKWRDFNPSYKWNDGSSRNNQQVFQKGRYWLEVSSQGCRSADTIQVDAIELAQLSDTTFCKGDQININVSLATLPSHTSIEWNTGSRTDQLKITDTGTYWFRIVAPPCVLSDTMRIDIEYCECIVFTPNAFTPNSDGINDYFLPIIEAGCPIIGYVLNIYDRYGSRIFHSNNPNIGWDGSTKALDMDSGVYFYELSFQGGTKKKHYYYKGDLTLIR